jgi:hypothetical protein
MRLRIVAPAGSNVTDLEVSGRVLPATPGADTDRVTQLTGTMTETGPIAFLVARLDEDESHARATLRPGGPAWSEVGRGERIPEMAHIERHSPARVLREVEAVRAIIKLREQASDPRFDDDQWNSGYAAAMRDVLGQLAAVDSDHPDYRPEWKP